MTLNCSFYIRVLYYVLYVLASQTMSFCRTANCNLSFNTHSPILNHTREDLLNNAPNYTPNQCGYQCPSYVMNSDLTTLNITCGRRWWPRIKSRTKPVRLFVREPRSTRSWHLVYLESRTCKADVRDNLISVTQSVTRSVTYLNLNSSP